MRPIQLILGSILVFTMVYYTRKVRSPLLNRAIVLVLIIVGILLIMFPEKSTLIANFLGVGRGADLVNYFGLIFLFFLYLTLLSEIRELKSSFTSLVRELALRNIHYPDNDELHTKIVSPASDEIYQANPE